MLTFDLEEVQVPANAVPALMVIAAVAAGIEEVQAPANAVPAPMVIVLVVAVEDVVVV